MKFLGLLFIVTAGAMAGESQDFARYQIIVERAPFGVVTSANAPETVPNFAQRFQLYGIVAFNNVPQAVLFDRESNRSWFKAEGEMIDGGVKVIKIQDKDMMTSRAKVVIQFGLETAALTLPERSASPVVVAPVPGQAQPAPNGAPPVRTPTGSRIPFRRSNS